MYYTYIIYSESIEKYYIGYSQDVDKRVERHNQGWSKSTKSGIPWIVKFVKKFELKSDAIKYERELKKKKSRAYLEKLIEENRQL